MKKYKVIKQITENGILYTVGSVIELSEQRAKQLEGLIELKQFPKELKNKMITKLKNKNYEKL
jgi:hypothetical protein